MTKAWLRSLFFAGFCLSLDGAAVAITIQDRALVAADRDHDNWRLHGRTYDNQRFSPLTQIDRANVGKLKLLHTLHTGVANSVEDTPLEVDGVKHAVHFQRRVFETVGDTG